MPDVPHGTPIRCVERSPTCWPSSSTGSSSRSARTRVEHQKRVQRTAADHATATGRSARLLSYFVTAKYGEHGLREDTIDLQFPGSAGQSFGAFLTRGITLRVRGDANDYIGKGLSGGKLIVAPPPEAGHAAGENVIVGNVALYGATGGEAYFRGLRRRAVRRPQQRRQGGGRGGGRPRLRVHDRRRGRRPRPRPAATSPPA